MTFRWKNCPEYICMIDFIENDPFVGKNYWKDQRLVKCGFRINGYMATLDDDKKIIAYAVIGWLPETKTLHI